MHVIPAPSTSHNPLPNTDTVILCQPPSSVWKGGGGREKSCLSWESNCNLQLKSCHANRWAIVTHCCYSEMEMLQADLAGTGRTDVCEVSLQLFLPQLCQLGKEEWVERHVKTFLLEWTCMWNLRAMPGHTDRQIGKQTLPYIYICVRNKHHLHSQIGLFSDRADRFDTVADIELPYHLPFVVLTAVQENPCFLTILEINQKS